MSTAEMMKRIAEASPRFKAKIAGVLYFLSVGYLCVVRALFPILVFDRRAQ